MELEFAPGFHRKIEVFLAIAWNVVALQADGALVAEGFEGTQEGFDVEFAAAEGLDEAVPFAGVIGTVDADEEEMGEGLLEAEIEVGFVTASEPVAEVEDEAGVGAVGFGDETQSIMRRPTGNAWACASSPLPCHCPRSFVSPDPSAPPAPSGCTNRRAG